MGREPANMKDNLPLIGRQGKFKKIMHAIKKSMLRQPQPNKRTALRKMSARCAVG